MWAGYCRALKEATDAGTAHLVGRGFGEGSSEVARSGGVRKDVKWGNICSGDTLQTELSRFRTRRDGNDRPARRCSFKTLAIYATVQIRGSSRSVFKRLFVDHNSRVHEGAPLRITPAFAPEPHLDRSLVGGW